MLESGFYNMDCMNGMAQFPDKFFELAIVDPPYSELCNLHGGHKSDSKYGWGGCGLQTNIMNGTLDLPQNTFQN